MREITGRKVHECNFCFRPIPKGVRHLTWTCCPGRNGDDGDSPWSGRGHILCRDLWSEITEELGWEESGLPHERSEWLEGLAHIKRQEPLTEPVEPEASA